MNKDYDDCDDGDDDDDDDDDDDYDDDDHDDDDDDHNDDDHDDDHDDYDGVIIIRWNYPKYSQLTPQSVPSKSRYGMLFVRLSYDTFCTLNLSIWMQYQT